jgi:hypothetical protein
MLKRLAVIQLLMLGSSEAINLSAYNQLVMEATKQTPPELEIAAAAPTAAAVAPTVVAKAAAVVETALDLNANAAKTEKEAAKATAEATAAAANADPILTVNTAHNAPRIK